MEGTEARQRRLEGCGRPKELGPPPAHDTERLPEVSEDGYLESSDSQSVPSKPLEAEPSRETALSIGFQVIMPFMFAGFGLTWAGLLLNYFQHWPVFTEVKDLLTLVPPLVGLKGNLEMTLASRLSTAANTGQIDDPQEKHKVISSNLAVVQVQATVVGLLAALASLLLGAMSQEELNWAKVALLCTSSVITAFLAAFALGILMVCIVIGARKFGVNPDNIATPIAASLGDLITLSILALISSFFYRHRDTWYLMPLVCFGFMALTPLWILIAKQNPPVMKILKFGWFPIILAMVISSIQRPRVALQRGQEQQGRTAPKQDRNAAANSNSCGSDIWDAWCHGALQWACFGGLILSKTISKHQYKGMAVLTPVICGVGGNLVAIQTSRISTFLHIWSTPGVLPLQMKRFWPNPCSTFCSTEINSVSARVLLLLVVPGHLIFFYLIHLVEGQSVTNSKTFVLLYLVASLIQVTVLLYLAEVMVRLVWRRALDPDNHCIPYLTGLGDLLGTGLLALCFLLDWLLRSRTQPAGLLELASVPP